MIQIDWQILIDSKVYFQFRTVATKVIWHISFVKEAMTLVQNLMLKIFYGVIIFASLNNKVDLCNWFIAGSLNKPKASSQEAGLVDFIAYFRL